MRHKVVRQIGLQLQHQARQPQRQRIRRLRPQHLPIERSPEPRKPRLHVPDQHDGLHQSLYDRGADERRHRSASPGGDDKYDRLRGLAADDEQRRRNEILTSDRDDLEKRRHGPRQDHGAKQPRIRHEVGAAENRDEHARPQHQRRRRDRPDRGMDQEDVQDHRRMIGPLPRQEVERAHPEAERQHGYGGADDEKRLFVDAEFELGQRSRRSWRPAARRPAWSATGSHGCPASQCASARAISPEISSTRSSQVCCRATA